MNETLTNEATSETENEEAVDETSTSPQTEETSQNEETSNPEETTEQVPDASACLLALQAASVALAAAISAVEEGPSNIVVGITEHLQAITQGIVSLPTLCKSTQSVEEANKQAFEGSETFLAMSAFAEATGQEIPEALYQNAFDKFKKPYTEANLPKAQPVKLSASFALVEKTEGQRGGRGNRGQGQNPDKKLFDASKPGKESQVYYNAWWNAYKEDGEFKDLLTEDEKTSSQFYAQGAKGTGFVKRLVELGKIKPEAQRGYMKTWADAQKVGEAPRFTQDTSA